MLGDRGRLRAMRLLPFPAAVLSLTLNGPGKQEIAKNSRIATPMRTSLLPADPPFQSSK